MTAEASLVTELAIILISAGVFTIISKALKQPSILGYIIAGFLVGPHLGIFPQFSTESVSQWSEIGIIFLLFSLGLEFSFKNLMKSGYGVLIMTGIKFAGMIFLGLVAGRAMGWSMLESVFLGGMLCMSSTTVIIKTYDDLKLKNKPYAPMVFGGLVLEDLAAIVLMVLLSTMAVSKSFAGMEMALSIGKLIFFLLLWFLIGIFLIPSILKKVKGYINDEIMLIVSIGLCFGMVTVANLTGFSSELGAFVMGSILSETVEAEHIEKLTKPIKDLFGAIFFVSVGMMLDPKIIAEHWGAILIIAILSVVGRAFFSTAGVIIAGKGIDNAVHTGFSMAQLGEFAFIIAGVGCSFGVMADFIYPVIVAVCVITAFSTPYVIKSSDAALAYIRKTLPPKFMSYIDPPQTVERDSSAKEKSEWSQLLKSYGLRILLYSVILSAILMVDRLWLTPLANRLLSPLPVFWRSLINAVIVFAIMLPFIFGLAIKNGKISKHATALMKENANNRWGITALMLLRMALALVFVLYGLLYHLQIAGWTLIIVILACLAFFFTAKISFSHIDGIEERFLANYNAKENAPQDKFTVKTITVSNHSPLSGVALRDSNLRAAGCTLISVMRGTELITTPSADFIFLPGDDLTLSGPNSAINSFE